jgi:tubulin-specific chaperone B
MAFQPTPADVTIAISTATSSPAVENELPLAAERRVTPSWTVSQLKAKLETMTGIPPGSQRLLLKAPGRQDQWIEGDERTVAEWCLVKGCEIEVCLAFSLECGGIILF